MNKQLLIALLPLLAACSSAPKTEPKTAASEASTADAKAQSGARVEDPGTSDKVTNVGIDDRILTACGIDKKEAFFEYNSAKLDPRYGEVLEKVAKCFATGALAGKGMRLIGHTDARGDEAYNQGLGERRAANVRSFIVSKGLSADKATTVSLGESNAKAPAECEGGKKACEEGWAADRHVDVRLAD